MSHRTVLKTNSRILPAGLRVGLRGETVFPMSQLGFRVETVRVRRPGLLLALIFLLLCQSAPGQILRKGMIVATNFSGFINNVPNAADPNGHVIAIIDIRNKTTAGLKPGTNWSSDPNYPGRIQQVNGTCYAPTAPDGNSAPINDRNNNPAGGAAHSILCYPPKGYASAPASGVFLSGGPSGTDPQLAGVPSSYEWSYRTMGQVFGLALDNQGDIFTTASSVYGDYNRTPNPLGGLVFRIDHLTGLVTPFITACNSPVSCGNPNQIPNTNGVGLGNIAFDPIHQQLLVTNFEDGKIYTLRGVSNPTGTIVGVYDPFAASGKSDEGTPGFADAGFSTTDPKNQSRRVWAIGVQTQGATARVYFSVWAQDQYRSSRAGVTNKIWSVALNNAGAFSGPVRDESGVAGTGTGGNGLTIPIFSQTSTPYNPQSLPGPDPWSNPISDIQFSSTGNMLIAERTMWSFLNGDYGSLSPSFGAQAAHNSRVLEFEYHSGSDNWAFKGQYYLSVFNQTSSSGGADYGYADYPENCEKTVWMSGDYLAFLQSSTATNADIVYGLEATGVANYMSATRSSTDYFIDLNNQFPGFFDKTTPGDVVVYRDPCTGCFIEVCKESSTKSPVTGNFTFTATTIPTPTDGTVFTSDPLVVPVGFCTGPIPVPVGTVMVTETPKPGTRVSAITAETGSSQNLLTSTDPPNGTATLKVAPLAAGVPSSETVLDFTNEGTGQLKVCKIAGTRVDIGTIFPFTVTGPAGSVSYMVPAGPSSEGGYCIVDESPLPVGTSVTVGEGSPAAIPVGCSYTLTGVTVSVNGTLIDSVTITNGLVPVKIGPGFTEATFTNTLLCSGPGSLADAEIVNYSLVSQQAAAGMQRYVTFRADLRNAGTILDSVTATLTSLDPANVRVVPEQGTLNFAFLPANGQVTSSNTFTILTNSAVPFDFSKLQWTFHAKREIPIPRPRR
jgi:hypothetical protein